MAEGTPCANECKYFCVFLLFLFVNVGMVVAFQPKFFREICSPIYLLWHVVSILFPVKLYAKYSINLHETYKSTFSNKSYSESSKFFIARPVAKANCTKVNRGKARNETKTKRRKKRTKDLQRSSQIHKIHVHVQHHF